MNPDQDLISGDFLELDVPVEKRYLLRYFTSGIQEAFLKYYLVFGSTDNFMDHTGIPCTDRWVRKMREKLVKLEKAHRDAKTAFDIPLLAIIEEGRHKV